jgi:hypothetical protein
MILRKSTCLWITQRVNNEGEFKGEDIVFEVSGFSKGNSKKALPFPCPDQ